MRQALGVRRAWLLRADVLKAAMEGCFRCGLFEHYRCEGSVSCGGTGAFPPRASFKAV